MTVAILGGGLTGCGVALELANRGRQVVLFERRENVVQEASRWNEGKLHLGFVYAADSTGKTTARMLDGSLSFLPILSRWIDLAQLGSFVSESFDYCVPADSLVSADEIACHFRQVDDQFRGVLNKGAAHYPGYEGGPLYRRVEVDSGLYDGRQIIARFQTAERAVNTGLVADAISEAVARHPLIELRLNTCIHSVQQWQRGKYGVLLSGQNPGLDGPFSHVVNALWSNRVLVDSRFGIDDEKPWMNRFKLGVFCRQASLPDALPTVTFVLGPYGDIVRFPGGDNYFSWYPAGMVGWNSEMADFDWCSVRAGIDDERLFEESMSGLAQFVPGLQGRLIELKAHCRVEGGAIFAWGNSDIGDIRSQLHQRHAIGVHRSGNYLSIDTGKYTTAPKFAMEAAQIICAGDAA